MTASRPAPRPRQPADALTGDAYQHFWMTRSMARSIGVNFTEALRDGRLSPSQYADLVARCCACPHGIACIEWLGRHSAAAPAAPDFCPNAQALESLRRGS